MPSAIVATEAAKAALARLSDEHGDIILHLTGGWCARTPLVLPRGDLKLGARDKLLGSVQGIPIYKMETAPSGDDPGETSYVLDVVDGLTIGFSLQVAPGRHFILTDAA
jgi:uncharacterized protein (DUF779 family)